MVTMRSTLYQGLATIGFTQWDLPHPGRLILEYVRESGGRLGGTCTGGEW